MIEDSYLSIDSPANGLFKDKGSKFLAFAFPVESETEIKNHLFSIKKEYYDARHHCYAYRLGHKGDNWRANDDGEPSSTAGKPIHGQLLSHNLTDILVVVVRYFGGTKLGVPGLIRAYKESTIDVINNSTICEKIATASHSFSFDYSIMNDVMKVLKEFSLVPVSQTFEINCSITVSIRLRDEERFLEAIKPIVTNLT